MNTALNTQLLESEPVDRLAANCKLPRAADTATAGWRMAGEPLARILYVDDEPSLRRLGKLVLFRAGYDVDTAADGVEAWASLKEVSYNLLITDNDMPRLTGLELAARVRQAGMRLPIMMTSGSPDFFADPAFGQLEIAAFLPKPFTPDVLVETVKQGLLAANIPWPRAGGPVSEFVRCALACQPHRHGGINE